MTDSGAAPPRQFTAEELAAYDGSDPDKPVFMSVRGTVFDVTAGRSFYGPGGPYAAFAGAAMLAQYDMHALLLLLCPCSCCGPAAAPPPPPPRMPPRRTPRRPRVRARAGIHEGGHSRRQPWLRLLV